MEIALDSNKLKTGFNKYGEYQFGKLTCQCCKSDNTEKTKFTEKEYSGYVCNVCDYKFYIKNE